MPEEEGGGDDPAPSFAYRKAFEEVFPFYLSIGMTYEQFWEQDVNLVKAYRKAWEMKQDQKNHELWLQGLYIYEAVCAASPIFNAFAKKGTKPHPYRDKPYDLRQEDRKKKRQSTEKKADQKARSIMEMWMVNINKKFEKKDGGENG